MGGKEKEKQVTVSVTLEIVLTKEDIDDIMCGALEGGINYWCRKAEVVGDYLGEYASEQIGRGGMLKLYDSEGDKTYELTRDKLLDGIKKYCEDTKRPYDIMYAGVNSVGCSTGEYGLDCCMVDATVADMIIQYAVMGEIVYG